MKNLILRSHVYPNNTVRGALAIGLQIVFKLVLAENRNFGLKKSDQYYLF